MLLDLQNHPANTSSTQAGMKGLHSSSQFGGSIVSKPSNTWFVKANPWLCSEETAFVKDSGETCYTMDMVPGDFRNHHPKNTQNQCPLMTCFWRAHSYVLVCQAWYFPSAHKSPRNLVVRWPQQFQVAHEKDTQHFPKSTGWRLRRHHRDPIQPSNSGSPSDASTFSTVSPASGRSHDLHATKFAYGTFGICVCVCAPFVRMCTSYYHHTTYTHIYIYTIYIYTRLGPMYTPIIAAPSWRVSMCFIFGPSLTHWMPTYLAAKSITYFLLKQWDFIGVVFLRLGCQKLCQACF